jgi:hypothetical protein
MADIEFVKELADRLNEYLRLNPERAVATLATPLAHAGYASVAHFLGQLSMPRNLKGDDLTNPGAGCFLVPLVEDNRITGFQALSAQTLLDQQKDKMS